MVKRIVSGIFILTALGALGVILAGAMTSGEQLIVRFLTAVTVAALALYVISDLRLQGEQEELATERNGSTTDRSATQTAAMAATASGGRGRNSGERSVRRSGDASVQPVPNFEAIEPVTARSRTVAHTDPTGTVTGSRLVPPSTEQTERVVPPHPMSGRTDAVDGRMAPQAAVPPSPLPIPDDDAARSGIDGIADDGGAIVAGGAMDDAGDGLAGTALDGKAGDRRAPKPGFVVPPDERSTSGDSVIATTSFTYSGRVDSFSVEWPPKPPVAEDSLDADLDGDGTAPVGTAEASTPELPALIGLPTQGSGNDSLLTAFAAELDDRQRQDGSGTGPSEPIADLFAVDTAEIPPFEPAEPVSAAEEDVSAGHPASGGPVDDPSPTEPGAGDPTVATPLIRRIEATDHSVPTRTEHLDLREPAGPVPIEHLDPPVPATPSSGGRSPERLTAAIRSGEVQVINSLISQGMLSTSGPITDRDVRTMVYVAFTSNELRKLILAGGTPDGIRAGDLDLGEVELFDESRFAPPPKLLYAGPPQPPEEEPEPILDLVALENGPATDDTSTSDLDHDVDDADLVHALPTPKHLYRRADADRVER